MATRAKSLTTDGGTELEQATAHAPSVIDVGREVTADFRAAISREWLVANGLGSFASGTVAGVSSRRYHGLLIAALQPPAGRTQLVAALDEVASYGGANYALATHQWGSGAIDPKGYVYIERFRLDGTAPVWTYALADALLEKRIWMQQGENTTYVQYTAARAAEPVTLELKPLVNYRDYHSNTHASDWRMQIEDVSDDVHSSYGVRVTAFPGAVPFFLLSGSARCEPRHEWYRNCFFSAERERGLDDSEDHLLAARFTAQLQRGQSLTLVFSTQPNPQLDGNAARMQRQAHEDSILKTWKSAQPRVSDDAPAWLPQLIQAADQFIVRRNLPGMPDGRSIIAGYHWFADWGRDTMISLPGLALTTGRPEIAKKILLAFSHYVDRGMLPNNFPDAGGAPEYNTVDAALWYFEAIRQYFAATNDESTLKQLFPMLAAMIDAHLAGTRYNIHVDPIDGLLYAGGPGVQLTWMDAKVGDWVVTPRTGKAVEINALWLNALTTMAQFAKTLGRAAEVARYEQLAAQATRSFEKFWNPQRNCLFDVIEAPGIGNDGSLRPNQIFAVSLPVSPLTQEQQKAVVDVCSRCLLTSHGLRSLAPRESGYIGHYGGTPRDRDAAYHQGTVWGWLLGPFAIAHHRVYGDAVAARQFLEPLARQIHSAGLGTVSEIFDADPPFSPAGCIAQAWTVAELLRAWHMLAESK